MSPRKKTIMKKHAPFLSLGALSSGILGFTVYEAVEIQKGNIMTKDYLKRIETLEKNKVDKVVIKQLIYQIKEFISNSQDENYKKTILSMLSSLEYQLSN